MRILVFSLVLMAGLVAMADSQVPSIESTDVSESDSLRGAAVEVMYLDYRDEFPNVPEIAPIDLAAWLEDSTLVLVDVRKTKEREVSVIPGSVSRDEYESHPGAYDGLRVVVYCTIGYRSGKYAKKLQGKDVDAWNLTEGILGWAHAGEPVENEGEPTRRVHVYGKRWSLLPAGYEAVW